MAKVFVNSNQTLKPEQEHVLNEKFGENWEVIPVPDRGFDQEMTKELLQATRRTVFFLDTNASLLLATLAYWSGYEFGNSFFGNQCKSDVYFLIEENGEWQLRDLTELV